MADRGSSGLSKAAKKNLQRQRAKQRAAAAAGATKPKDDNVVTPEELKDVLNREMEAAKEKNDQEAMKSLREQIWVVNDMIAGVKTDLPGEELKRILEKLPISNALKKKQKARKADPKENKEPNIVEPKESGEPNPKPEPEEKNSIQASEKRLRNLKKKLKEARKIKEKMANGETVEKNQKEKAALEASLVDEIEDLELDIKTAKLNS